MAWTNKQTLLNSTQGIGTHESLEFVPVAPPPGSELQVVAVMTEANKQNPACKWTVYTEVFQQPSGQWSRVGGVMPFVGGPSVPADSLPGLGIDPSLYGQRCKMVLSKESDHNVTLRLREGFDDE